MKTYSRNYRIFIIAVLLPLIPTSGCRFIGQTATPTLLPPTVTTAPIPTQTIAPALTATAAPSPAPESIAQETGSAPVPPMANEEQAAYALQNQVITVYETVGPTVVNIISRSYVVDMFMRAVPQEGSGSGFVYDEQGHIVTNFHVIENAEQLLVTLASGQVYEADLVGSDPTNDLAVIRIDAGENLPPPMVLGDSDQLRVGQFVLAIGNPFGLEQTLTTGVISALGRVIESPEDDRFIGESIQTDAAINPGNSGGPLLDLKGYVIGVNSQIISPSRASAGIGFAVSANTVQRVVPELISRGYYPHPWLGTRMLSLTPATAELFRQAGMNIPVDAGLLIIETVRGAAAEKAGIRGGQRLVRIGQFRVPLDGDIIVAINGASINNFEEWTVYLETQTLVGDTVNVTVIRDGEELILPVILEERPQRF
jgi:S1-C subfamily serine protease